MTRMCGNPREEWPVQQGHRRGAKQTIENDVIEKGEVESQQAVTDVRSVVIAIVGVVLFDRYVTG